MCSLRFKIKEVPKHCKDMADDILRLNSAQGSRQFSKDSESSLEDSTRFDEAASALFRVPIEEGRKAESMHKKGKSG